MNSLAKEKDVGSNNELCWNYTNSEISPSQKEPYLVV